MGFVPHASDAVTDALCRSEYLGRRKPKARKKAPKKPVRRKITMIPASFGKVDQMFRPGQVSDLRFDDWHVFRKVTRLSFVSRYELVDERNDRVVATYPGGGHFTPPHIATDLKHLYEAKKR